MYLFVCDIFADRPERTGIIRDRDRWKSLEEAFVEEQAVEGKTDCYNLRNTNTQCY